MMMKNTSKMMNRMMKSTMKKNWMDEDIDPSEIDDLIAEAQRRISPIQTRIKEQTKKRMKKNRKKNRKKKNKMKKSPKSVTQQTKNSLRNNNREDRHRNVRPMSRLEPSMKGQSYVQDSKTMAKVTFKDEGTGKLEYCHNLITQVHPNPNEDVEYATSHAMLIARVMDDINSKVSVQGASFAQQYILQKGLKVFGNRGRQASTKEMDQLHRRNCFTPISVKELMPTE